jgi:hypothetical protein
MDGSRLYGPTTSLNDAEHRLAIGGALLLLVGAFLLPSGAGLAAASAAAFLEVNKPKPVVLFELPKGWLSGKRVEPGETHELREPHR